jgi:hypothetical protein
MGSHKHIPVLARHQKILVVHNYDPQSVKLSCLCCAQTKYFRLKMLLAINDCGNLKLPVKQMRRRIIPLDIPGQALPMRPSITYSSWQFRYTPLHLLLYSTYKQAHEYHFSLAT